MVRQGNFPRRVWVFTEGVRFSDLAFLLRCTDETLFLTQQGGILLRRRRGVLLQLAYLAYGAWISYNLKGSLLTCLITARSCGQSSIVRRFPVGSSLTHIMTSINKRD